MTRAGVNDKSQLMRQIEKYAGEAAPDALCTAPSPGRAPRMYRAKQRTLTPGSSLGEPETKPMFLNPACLRRHVPPPCRHLHQPRLQLPALHTL